MRHGCHAAEAPHRVSASKQHARRRASGTERLQAAAPAQARLCQRVCTGACNAMGLASLSAPLLRLTQAPLRRMGDAGPARHHRVFTAQEQGGADGGEVQRGDADFHFAGLPAVVEVPALSTPAQAEREPGAADAAHACLSGARPGRPSHADGHPPDLAAAASMHRCCQEPAACAEPVLAPDNIQGA